VDIKLTDLMLDEDLGETYRVHSGYLTTAKNMIGSVVPILEQLYQTSEYKDYKIVCTGHSLGGAISSLICYFLRKKGYVKSVCYAYAMPVVGTDNVAELFKDFCFSVVCGHDLISRLSQYSWYSFTKDVERILNEADVPKYKVIPSMILNAIFHRQYYSRGFL
jgi:sn1-specific diacylglycerol lipase